MALHSQLTRWLKASVVALAAVSAADAKAAVIILGFEGVADQASVADFYNGGTDSVGNSGTNFGIGFSERSLGLIDQDAGGTGNIANEPSPDTVLVFLAGGAATMNVAAGFDTGFSFFYASNATDAGSVTVFDGLDGTGNILATLTLTPNGGSCAGDPTGFPFCNFTPIGVTFSGTARSADFAGVNNQIVFDNITLGSADPGAPVPEPASMALLGLGIAALGLARRRRV